MAGGTGLYISAVVENYELREKNSNTKVRQEIESLYNKKSLNYLVKQLTNKCPKIVSDADLKNPRRVIRLLEICKVAGDIVKTKGVANYNVLLLGIDVPREQLYERINKRVDKMLKNGLVKEVAKLSKKYSFDLPAMSGIGYRQIGEYLKGNIDLDEAIRLMKRDSRHYAKRQITWWRRNKNIKWIKDYKQSVLNIKEFLSKY